MTSAATKQTTAATNARIVAGARRAATRCADRLELLDDYMLRELLLCVLEEMQRRDEIRDR